MQPPGILCLGVLIQGACRRVRPPMRHRRGAPGGPIPVNIPSILYASGISQLQKFVTH